MENNNSVCFVARINEIKPIEGADKIEQGVIGGWNCIIQKGQYKVDELVAVATTDAVILQVVKLSTIKTQILVFTISSLTLKMLLECLMSLMK